MNRLRLQKSPEDMDKPENFTLVITAHRGGPMLEACLKSAAQLAPGPADIVVAIDGAAADVKMSAENHGFRVISLPEAPGVSAARNAGASAASGSIIVFADSDVLLPADFIAHAARAFAEHSEAAAVIGSYDDSPAAPGIVSRYRNLLHHYTHQHGSAEAETFWAGCGAIRRKVFSEVGGFDETFHKPSVEDIELGYRLRKAGHRIRLVPSWQVKHLKKWRLRDLVFTDIGRRAIPWTRLLRREGRLDNDLNIDRSSRLSAALICLAACALASGFFWRPAFPVGGVLLSSATTINWRYYRFLVRLGGLPFALASIPLHWLYFLGATAGFVAGHVLQAAPTRTRSGNSHSNQLPFEDPEFNPLPDMPLPAHATSAVVGAGPAGLTAAFELARCGHHPLVLEASNYIGGISRTHRWNGNRLDIGGHRFFTKSGEVKKLWSAMMDEPMLKVPRLSRIYYRGKYFHYPLRITNSVANLGLLESFMMVGSYVRAQLRHEKPEDSFERWVRNRFGDRLYRTFFKTYTEKVWGIPCTEIRADWAAQRIHGLSFVTAVMNALRNSGKVKSLVKTFDYPRLGPGMLWESAARKVVKMGGTVAMESRVTRLRHQDGKVTSIDITTNTSTQAVTVDRIVSTMPLSALARQLDPAPPAQVLAAADGLKYRDFLIVALACNKADVFPDNWIYIHSPEVRVGRIQNFRNWSPDLVATGNGTTLGMEYFCARGDDLWNMGDDDLIALAKRELVSLGLAGSDNLTEGHVVREANAYPVYDTAYQGHVETLREYFTKTFTNLQTAGRNGMHRYNNQDHSMIAGQHAALRLLGRSDLDPWDINTEQSYYEEQVLSPDEKHTGINILVADIAPPHESV